MDIKFLEEVLLLVVGSVIGFLASIGIVIVERLIDRTGSVKIYYKFIRVKSNNSVWGVYEDLGLTVLVIPVVFELQNTTNTSRVIRDLSLDLYKNSQYVCKMRQINESKSDSRSKFASDYTYGNNGAYSFVLAPRSITKIECFYSYYIDNAKLANKDFNSIAISYYDEADKKVSLIAKSGLNGWKMKENDADYDWILLK